MAFPRARWVGGAAPASCKALRPAPCLPPKRISKRPNLTRPAHHFTVDVEEYFQVVALEGYVARGRWSSIESRLRHGMDQLLELFDEADVRCTCFILGWIAERHPALVRSLAAAGHEIASHGWDHVRVTHQPPSSFRDSVRTSKQLLEQLTGAPVLGYRAPSFSIVRGREWALDVLIEEGYKYDSSVFPVRRPDAYGYAGAPRDPYMLIRESGQLLELPMATLRLGGMNIPAAGGGYFRLLPYALVKAAFHSCERRGVPGTFYIHPWELDAAQPRLPVPRLTRMRHYGGLARTRPRLRRLLREFRFRPVADFLRDYSTSDARGRGKAAAPTISAEMSPAAGSALR